MRSILRINTDTGVMIHDGQSRFSINGKPICHLVGTSTFSEYSVIHVGCVAKIRPLGPLDKFCPHLWNLYWYRRRKQSWGVAVLVGLPHKEAAFMTPYELVEWKDLKGTFFGNCKPHSGLPSAVEKCMNKELELEKFITHKFPFAEINKAFDLMLKEEGLPCICRS
ncbi:alcohol dehydrogenase 1, partial [Nicotiana attenuata]